MAAAKLVMLVSINYASCLAMQKSPERQVTPQGKAIDLASTKLFKEVVMEAGDENVISSPIGVMTLLSLYAAGAGPELQSDIVKALGSYNYSDIYSSYSEVSQRFDAMDNNFLTVANKIYVNEGAHISKTFAEVAANYRSQVDTLDFKNTNQAADVINKWAEEKTKGKLKNPVSPDQLTPDTVAALFNIIFFQGHWHVPFDAAETKDHDFRVNEKVTIKKPMMYLSQSLSYLNSEILDSQIVELPYKEKGFRMVIVLPNKDDGLPHLLEKVAKGGILEEFVKLKPQRSDVQVLLPKFEVKSDLDLNKILPKIGLGRLFTDAATGILEDEAVVVSKAFQKTFIKVDEEGATAGALTGAGVVLLSWTPPIEFHADHPFLYYVMHEDIPLFIGAYRK